MRAAKSKIASGGDLCGAFAIKENQVRGIRRRAELAEHRGELAAVICSVIHEVLKHLPEWRGLWSALGGFVFDDTR